MHRGDTMSFKSLLAGFVLLTIAGSAFADSADTPRTLSVNGRATVAAAPDMARITVGVVTTAPTARAALTANNEKAGQVIAFLGKSGVADTDMQSANLSISPQYRQRRRDEPQYQPEIIGYVVNNNLSVAIRNLDSFGQVLDGVVTAGANNVNGIRFDVSNRDALEREATAKAVKDSIARARNIAAAAGAELGDPITISEGGGFRPPQPFLARAESSAVPIATGELSIGASVSVVFAIE